MKIIKPYYPGFEHDGIAYTVEPYAFGSFIAFQLEIDKMEDAGYNYCYLYEITNCDFDGNLLNNGVDDTGFLHIRAKFLK